MGRLPDLAPQQLRDEGLLKIFAGADPRVIFARRGDWHRVKLAELEGYLEHLHTIPLEPCHERWRGAELTLQAGIAYHRQMLATIDEFLASDASASDAPVPDAPATGEASG